MEPSGGHLLRLLVSCRKITAQVTVGGTDTIIAMASSGRAGVRRGNPGRGSSAALPAVLDERVAARVGEKPALRLHQIGVADVRLHIDDGNGSSMPLIYRRQIASLFDSVERAGIRVSGADEVRYVRSPSAGYGLLGLVSTWRGDGR
ncbi:hypothetical protein HPP92_012335 [Vanilla planifolia]|uniref:Uncharacterized protein n=1 Tax=Vanilla planifolia TaxID=51239 RepID=A0A835QUY9_VANPL|nr:hypothetical protein HPP92_012335 [Vanilla planifolia]